MYASYLLIIRSPISVFLFCLIVIVIGSSVGQHTNEKTERTQDNPPLILRGERNSRVRRFSIGGKGQACRMNCLILRPLEHFIEVIFYQDMMVSLS